MTKKLLLVATLALAACAIGSKAASAKSIGPVGATAGVTAPGSPYRYVAISPGFPHKLGPHALTVVERIDCRNGKVDRWWYLKGFYYVPAVTYDGVGGGLSADGRTLVLERFSTASSPRKTRLAILRTDLYLRHPLRPGRHRPAHAINRVTLDGNFSVDAISSDGSTVYLTRQHPHDRASDDFEPRALDTRSGELTPQHAIERHPAEGNFLSFTQTPRFPGNLLGRAGIAGRSAAGRPIEVRQLGDPAIAGKLLIFGCIHGDECAASGIEPLHNGCPDPEADIYLVPNLNPDGAAEGTRLNGRGVDLNRNFPSGWKPIGRRGDPQYSGPRPYSEPETRLAGRIVHRLQPKVTVWFHQHDASRPLVRAWGQSAPAARRLARMAKLPFHLLPWPAGTAPNWQNHRFPGTGSFVVELPPGRLSDSLRSRLSRSLDRLGREVGKD
jgi:protein MpaA